MAYSACTLVNTDVSINGTPQACQFQGRKAIGLLKKCFSMEQLHIAFPHRMIMSEPACSRNLSKLTYSIREALDDAVSAERSMRTGRDYGILSSIHAHRTLCCHTPGQLLQQLLPLLRSHCPCNRGTKS